MPANQAAGARPILSVRNLKITIRTPVGQLHATDGISYDVNPGETFAVVGESGCGKSISSLALMGLLPKAAEASADLCEFDGQPMLSLSRRELSKIRGNTISMIFQDPMTSLNPVYTIGNQLTEVYVRHGKGGRKEATDRAVFLLERVGIKNAAQRLSSYPHQLSGGLRQRVVIAMAMMCGPKLIIADEPTTALDVTVQTRTLSLLAELQRDLGLAIILITHDLGVVASMADRVAVMYAGRIVETAPTQELFAAPLHPYTQGLIKCIPTYDQSVGPARLHTIPGMVPSLFRREQACTFHNRCEFARAECTAGTVDFRNATETHRYACIHSRQDLLGHWQTARTQEAV